MNDAIPEGFPDLNVGATLLDAVVDTLHTYVILPKPEAYHAMALWIAATHAVPAWHTAPRLVIKAPEKRCGKTRLMDITEALSHNPMMTVNCSSSALYRSISAADNDPPTLLIDEADTIFGSRAGENEDLRGLLNAGHQRGRTVTRYNAATNSTEHLTTFCMAALAGIGSMPDTIEDRAVIIKMRRRAPGETVSSYRIRRDGPTLVRLRCDLHQWVRANLNWLTAAEPPMPVEDRAADTWEPLIAIADLAGDHWPDLARTACLELSGGTDAPETASLRIRLLIDARTAFERNPAAHALPTSALIDYLKADEDAPWRDLNPGGITPRRLAQLLREYDIASRNHRWPDGTQSKGYAREDFDDAWTRYCPPLVSDNSLPVVEEEGGEHPSPPSHASHRRSARGRQESWDG